MPVPIFGNCGLLTLGGMSLQQCCAFEAFEIRVVNLFRPPGPPGGFRAWYCEIYARERADRWIAFWGNMTHTWLTFRGLLLQECHYHTTITGQRRDAVIGYLTNDMDSLSFACIIRNLERSLLPVGA